MHRYNGRWAAVALALALVWGRAIAFAQDMSSNPSTQPSSNQQENGAGGPALPPPEPVAPGIPQAAPASQPEAVPAPMPSAVTPRIQGPVPSTTTMATTPVSAAPISAQQLHRVVVTSMLDQSRDQIAPSLGATTYEEGPQEIEAIPQGENATFQQVLLRMPGVVQDSFGQEHVRGDHGNLTYRVNGVLLPQPLSGFGQEIDSHLIDSVTLIDGTLPAQFGFQTAGIIDVTTKSGANMESNELSIYGGSNDMYEPSFEVGGAKGKWDYFVTGSYLHDSLGIENPTGQTSAIHDDTEQSRLFSYMSYHIDDTSRLSVLLNGSYSRFQIPDTAGLAPSFTLSGVPFFNSADINENQDEQNYYGVISYQKSVDRFSMQASAFYSYGQIHFIPDQAGDLIYSGVAGDITDESVTGGLQVDSSYILDPQHTLRGGVISDYTTAPQETNTSVFPVDGSGAQTSSTPIDITENFTNTAVSSGIYLQDEWKLSRTLTLNYGLRYDRFDANFDHEEQPSPRANLVWKADGQTTLHGGYSRYFVTPPIQNVPPSAIAPFAGTTNAPANFMDSAPKCERSNYFDAGISHQIDRPWTVNLDTYFKKAHNLIDEGQFGAAVIETPFNYTTGYDYGAELSSTFKQDALSLYGNFAWNQCWGRNIDSQQFTIANDELAYIQDNYIHLDHQAEYTVSTGASYNVTTNDRVSTDLLYSSGLRDGFANTGKVPAYYPVNAGYEHVFHAGPDPKQLVKVRFDIVNVFDQSYEIRDGSGIGVGAPQFGARRGFFVGLAYDF